MKISLEQAFTILGKRTEKLENALASQSGKPPEQVLDEFLQLPENEDVKTIITKESYPAVIARLEQAKQPAVATPTPESSPIPQEAELVGSAEPADELTEEEIIQFISNGSRDEINEAVQNEDQATLDNYRNVLFQADKKVLNKDSVDEDLRVKADELKKALPPAPKSGDDEVGPENGVKPEGSDDKTKTDKTEGGIPWAKIGLGVVSGILTLFGFSKLGEGSGKGVTLLGIVGLVATALWAGLWNTVSQWMGWDDEKAKTPTSDSKPEEPASPPKPAAAEGSA
ncbi:MAG: hypothetical protein HY094_02425 [Candidatus Melainabacteria bacterium]|nr:hypothetical protein [Candidatus Melainabacteria bacterium]